MERRSLLKSLSTAAAMGAVTSLGAGRTLSAEAASGVVKTMGHGGPLAQARDAARKGMPPLTIRDVKIIATAPSGSNWTIVKVETSEPGLYGLGAATHQEIPQAAQAYIEKRLKPFVIGKNCDDIEDIWQSAYLQEYFRSGPEGNDALSGIDGALWDILGKRLGVPVYRLLGGKVRAAVPLYGHAAALTQSALNDQVQAYIEKGYQVVRIQLAVPGWSGYGVSGAKTSSAVQALRPDGVTPSPVFDAGRYLTTTIGMFEAIRAKFGFDIGLVHDVHERPAPNQSIELCRAVEQYRPFYMEDPLSPEDVGWFQIFRQETSAPLAMGELFTNRNEWLNLVANRWIDFIRIHQSSVGGLNMCRKVAHCCEFFDVRTAWHGPNNVDPIGHCYNLHLNLVTPNFGIQEETFFDEKTREVFPGTPEIRKGYIYSNDKPGLGIDIDEKAAARYPYTKDFEDRGNDRMLDGTIVRP
ncbi:MAG: enolase C-terminal domain-like protein [Acidobacteriaceae bacterium]|jgi:mannonate dehydratase